MLFFHVPSRFVLFRFVSFHFVVPFCVVLKMLLSLALNFQSCAAFFGFTLLLLILFFSSRLPARLVLIVLFFFGVEGVGGKGVFAF